MYKNVMMLSKLIQVSTILIICSQSKCNDKGLYNYLILIKELIFHVLIDTRSAFWYNYCSYLIGMIEHASKSELLNILQIIDRWSRYTNTNSGDILKDLSSLLPFEIALSATGDTSSLTVDRLINNKFPLDYLQIYFNQKMMQNDPFVAETTSLMKSRFYDMESYLRKEGYKRYAEFNNAFGLTHRLSSAFSESNGKTTLICLAKPMEKPHQRYLQIADFLIPHLHHTISRIYKTENGNNNLHNLSNLTAREIEILKWVKEGKTNWEISQITNISVATVKFHLANILKKLDAVNRGHAVAKALETKILSL